MNPFLPSLRSLAAAALFALVSPLALAQTSGVVNISVTPSSANGRATPTITWSTSPAGATGCTASGGWSGSKAAGGTQVLPQIVANTTYSLTCSWPGSPAVGGTVSVNWTAPTTNLDGTPLTNLAGFRVLYGRSATTLDASAYLENPAARTWTSATLAQGDWYFVVRAFNSTGAESDNSSPVVRKTVGTPATAGFTASNSATVTIVPIPSPPTGVTVVDATVFQAVRDGRRAVAQVLPGATAKLGVPCDDWQSFEDSPDIRSIARSNIHLKVWVPDHQPLYARCGGA